MEGDGAKVTIALTCFRFDLRVTFGFVGRNAVSFTGHFCEFRQTWMKMRHLTQRKKNLKTSADPLLTQMVPKVAFFSISPHKVQNTFLAMPKMPFFVVLTEVHQKQRAPSRELQKGWSMQAVSALVREMIGRVTNRVPTSTAALRG